MLGLGWIVRITDLWVVDAYETVGRVCVTRSRSVRMNPRTKLDLRRRFKIDSSIALRLGRNDVGHWRSWILMVGKDDWVVESRQFDVEEKAQAFEVTIK